MKWDLIYIIITLLFYSGNGFSQSNSQMKADSLYKIATGEYDKQNFDQAINLYLQSLQLYEANKNPKGLTKTYNSLGLLYKEIGQFYQSEKCFNSVLNILESSPDKRTQAFVLNNLGMLFVDRDQLDSALFYYTKSLELKESIKDSMSMSTTLNNIGVVMLELKKYPEAIYYNKKSLKIKQAYNDTLGTIAAYSNFANIYGYWGKLDSVKLYLDKGMLLVRKTKHLKSKKGYYVNYSSYFRANNNYEKALTYYDSILEINQRIFNEEMNSNLVKYNVLYETEKKNIALKEEKYSNLLLKEQKQKEKNKKYVYITLTLSLLVILLLLWLYYKVKIQKSKNQHKLLEKEMEINAKELLGSSTLMLQKQEILNDLRLKIEDLKTKEDKSPDLLYKTIESTLRQNANMDHEWNKFKTHFETIHDSFFSRLKNDVTQLTENDLRHCAFIKIGLTTKEISSLLNITPSSVQTSRVRLKKKLGLDKGKDLHQWIKSF